jgi:hypothetical protein
MVRESLKVAQTRQKSYAEKRRRDLLFKVGDFVYLKVSPMRGTRRFKVKGKLAPRYVGPFQIIDRKGEVAYQLELPSQLSDVHERRQRGADTRPGADGHVQHHTTSMRTGMMMYSNVWLELGLLDTTSHHQRCRSGFTIFSPDYYKSSPLWFIVRGIKSLIHLNRMNTEVYEIRAAGA